jgi:dolichyl-phosphate-mannose-protein mannosyltransferase
MKAASESHLTELQEAAPPRARRWRDALLIGLPLAAGLALRIWMLKALFEVNGDALIYGGIAKNLLLHGRYDLTLPGGEMYPTLIRLPGYPVFLALCFKLFGMENYFSASCVQVAMDLVSCLLLADFARRITKDGCKRCAGMATLWLAALCPFTASYVAFPMAETPTIFALALALWAMARFREWASWSNALWFTFAVTCATLLRPDGALAGICFAPALLIGMRSEVNIRRIPLRKLVRMAAFCVLLALAPFAVWAARNWTVFHVFEPLAPRLANDPGESPNPGWERWVKSWCLDFVSTYEIYWNVPWDKLDVSELPKRAFDSPAQYAETAALAADYNNGGMEITPQIDARFDRLAAERIAANPLRYYVCLPVGRVADMWLRPRVENLPIDLDWWVYAHHHKETEFSWAYVGLNGVYLILALAGVCVRPRFSTPQTKNCPWGPRFWFALLAYLVLRSVLLLTIEAPEARYTLECFPMLFALGGVAMSRVGGRIYLSKEKAFEGRG